MYLAYLRHSFYSHFFNWFFVVRDPFYAIPEAIAPFVMPFLNICVFLGVEIIIHIVILVIQRIKRSKTVWVRILNAIHEKYLFRSLDTRKKTNSLVSWSFFNEINPLRDLWNALRAWNALRVWNALRRVRGFILFHIDQREIFHNFRKEIISHSATPNISLAIFPILCYTNLRKAVDIWKEQWYFYFYWP